ncbi:MAG: hypothetical protein HY791_02855 [Deltaproteobacteria bacterium]|nr:hypothetical protein [Deltaproteobacteria bacterium]
MTISAQNPAQDATGVFIDISPAFHLSYGGAGFPASSVAVTVSVDGGAPIDVIVGGAFQAGYTGTLTGSDGEFDITINPDADFPASVLIAFVAQLEDTYSFTTGTEAGGGGDPPIEPGEETLSCTLAQDRLIQVLKKPRILTLLCILGNRAQPVINSMNDTIAARDLATAGGAQLDALEVEYRLPRNGASDATYRVRLQAAAQIVSSRGTGDELLDILTTLDAGAYPATIALIEHFPAAMILTFQVASGAWLVGQLYSRLLHRVPQGGCRLVAMFEEDRVDLFVWDDEAGNGWQDEDDPDNTGGVWAEGMG